jgi:ferredoxin-NADP reductase
MRISRKDRENASVISLVLEPNDGHTLAAALPGQFIVQRLKPAPDASALLRSYSLSGEPRDDRYRLSIKQETHGAAGAYIHTRVRVGDVLDVSAPRGSFTLRPGSGAVILLSAGVGATPMMAMLHALVVEGLPREVWWIYGARNGGEHPFAARDAHPPQGSTPQPQPHSLQLSSSGGQAGCRFRRSRALRHACDHGAWGAARRGFLPVRAARLH